VFVSALAQPFITGTVQMLNVYIDWAKKAIGSEGTRLSPEVGVAITSDALLLVTHVQSTLYPIICEATLHSCDDVIENVLSSCVTELRSVADSAWSSVISSISSACVFALSEVKTISGTYVLTGKPAPTRASPFATKFLKGLQEFLGKEQQLSGIPSASVRHLVIEVLSNTARQYDAAIVDLQASVSSRLAGVAALGWMKAGGSNTPGTFSAHRVDDVPGA
jgi:hypothetical protein